MKRRSFVLDNGAGRLRDEPRWALRVALVVVPVFFAAMGIAHLLMAWSSYSHNGPWVGNALTGVAFAVGGGMSAAALWRELRRRRQPPEDRP